MGSAYAQAIPLIFHHKEDIPFIHCKSFDYKESRSEIFINRIHATPRIRIHTTPRIRIHATLGSGSIRSLGSGSIQSLGSGFCFCFERKNNSLLVIIILDLSIKSISRLLLGEPEVAQNIYCKSRNLPNTDTQKYSTDLR